MELPPFLKNFAIPVIIFMMFSGTILLCCFGCFQLMNRRDLRQELRQTASHAYDSITSIRFSVPGRDYLYSQLPSSFAGDIEAGLSSSTFDLNENLDGGDSRAGLDDEAKREILKIMKRRRLKFDQARKVYMEQRFAANGISPDGRPRDPKFVSFS